MTSKATSDTDRGLRLQTQRAVHASTGSGPRFGQGAAELLLSNELSQDLNCSSRHEYCGVQPITFFASSVEIGARNPSIGSFISTSG